MMENGVKAEAGKAMRIGAVCIFSYLACYYLRNLLGVTRPEMLEDSMFNKEYIGLLSSVYFLIYAAGQLLNGILGDIFSPKKMVIYGLGISGLITMIFPLITMKWLQVVCFGLMGFGLSMLRGPLVKTFSENTIPKYARIIAVFFSYASFTGSLIASLLSIIFDWKWTFIVAGFCSLLIAATTYITFTSMEQKGMITYSSAKSRGFKGLFGVFKIEKFIFYMIIGAIVEIAGASISFWIPTYLTERMNYGSETAALIYSGISFIRSFTPFIALAIFRGMKENDVKLTRISFVVATSAFILLIFIKNPYLNIVVLLLALMAVGCSGALLWSIYIPGLGRTGMVSSVNGILDCSGYIAAAAANLLFANIIDRISWNGVIAMWAAIAFVGVATTWCEKSQVSL